jgi:hypothetical protein
MKAWVRQLPTGAFLIVLCGWVLGAFVGGLVAAKIQPATWLRHAVLLGVLLLAASVMNMMKIPHPAWMWIGAFLFIVPGAYLGARVASGAAPPVQRSTPSTA